MKYFFLPNILGVVLLSVLLWSACSKISDLGDIEIQNDNAEFAIPLGQAAFSFASIIDNFDDNTFATIENDGLVRLNYRGDVLEVSSNTLFDRLSAQTALVPFPVTDTVSNIDFDIGNSIFVEYVLLKAGTLAINFKSNHDQNLEVELTLEHLFEDGQPIVKNYSLEPNAQKTEILSVNGIRWNANNNQFTVRYKAINEDGERVMLDNFFIVLANLEYSYAEGYLGNDLYEVGRDTIEIDFFERWQSGNIYFEEPVLRLTAFNSFGFPLDAKLNTVQIITVDGSVLPLESQFVEDGIEVDYPPLTDIGGVRKTVFTFDNDNSNIREVLSSSPVAIDYDLDGEPNPDTNTDILGFVTDTSYLRVQVEAELPIYGAASDFSVQDTIEVDFSDYENELSSAEFKIVSENEMPLEILLQVYFANDEGTLLDSLFVPAQKILEAAPVDANGNVTMSSEKVVYAPIDAVRFANLTNATKLILDTEFSTTNNGETSVRVLAGQDVNLRMGMKVIR